MKKLMVLAAMLAMMLVAAAPAFAEQTSGDATAGGATLTAGDLANQAVQVANNVNSGNVSQTATAVNVQSNVGAEAVLSQNATATGDDALAANIGVLLASQDVNQTVDQNASNTIVQGGIDQINNAQQTCNQAIAQTQK